VATTKDLGDEALDRIVKVWQVDDDRVIWSDNGFDWWPGSYRVSVRVHPSPPEYEEEPEPAWRLVVRTSLAKDVDATNPEVRTRIALFAALSPTYAMVYAPPELGEKYPEAVDGTLWLQSSIYLRPDSSGWLPEFFARTAILQPSTRSAKARRLRQCFTPARMRAHRSWEAPQITVTKCLPWQILSTCR
jgi:hypothetical protein